MEMQTTMEDLKPLDKVRRFMNAHLGFSCSEDEFSYEEFTNIILEVAAFAKERGLKLDSLRNNYNW